MILLCIKKCLIGPYDSFFIFGFFILELSEYYYNDLSKCIVVFYLACFVSYSKFWCFFPVSLTNHSWYSTYVIVICKIEIYTYVICFNTNCFSCTSWNILLARLFANQIYCIFCKQVLLIELN